MQESKFIPKKGRPKKIQPVKTEETPKIPKDLEDKFSAVKACATAYNVMQAGHYPHSYLAVLTASLGFLKVLYKQALDEALKHPNANLLPELVDLRKEIQEQADGATQKN